MWNEISRGWHYLISVFASSFSRTEKPSWEPEPPDLLLTLLSGIILNLWQHFSSFIISSKAKLKMTDNELMPPEVAVWCDVVGEVLLGGLFVVGGPCGDPR